MGIGNHTWKSCSPAILRSSLPLMGIGNSCAVIDEPPGDCLITPHGDRERYRLTGCCPPAPCSLPLMGIGNDAGGVQELQAIEAHYPSWGSGTTNAANNVVESLISLPLMGIGNADRQYRADSDAAALITPHGDREP